jgi:hypothetical protein
MLDVLKSWSIASRYFRSRSGLLRNLPGDYCSRAGALDLASGITAARIVERQWMGGP